MALDSAPKDRLQFNQSFALIFFKALFKVCLLTVVFVKNLLRKTLLMKLTVLKTQKVSDAIVPKYAVKYLTGL